MSRYQEFQKKQVQCLLELREAQADTEAERRLEHLQQVRGGRRVAGGRVEPVLGQTCQPRVTCWPPVSVGSAEAQGDCPGRSHDSVEETEGNKREVKAGISWAERGSTPWCHEVGRETHTHRWAETHTDTQTHTHPCPAVDPACSPTGSSREKKELQKILDRKRHNSISEAKTREKHKKEA